MPTVQEANLMTAVRMPGYHGYFTGTDLRRTGTATAEINRKCLPESRRYADLCGDRTSMYNPLSDAPASKTRPGSMLERRARTFDRNVGIPRYNTFNCVDWSETKPITANDEKDSLALLNQRAINDKGVVPKGLAHLHKPVSLHHILSHSNFDQFRTKKVFPLPGDTDYGKHLYKTWAALKPSFSEEKGAFSHKMWGVQQEDGTGLLDYRKEWQDQTRLYRKQEDYRKLVEDRRQTARDVMSVVGVNYSDPTSSRYRPMHVTADVNPTQKQMCNLYKQGNLWTPPHSYVGPPLFY